MEALDCRGDSVLLAMSIFSYLQHLLTPGGDNMYFPFAMVSVVNAQPVSSIAPAHPLCDLGVLS